MNLFKRKSPLEKSQQENFISWLRGANTISQSLDSKEEKRRKLCEHLDSMSEDLYLVYFPQIVEIIQKSKANCEPFKNSEEQVNNILSWLPRLKDNKELLLMYIRERRKKYKLKV